MSDEAASRPLRALIYDRASVDLSGQARSVASQDVENRAFCERQGWTIVATIEDNDLSASPWATKQRPGYAEAQARIAGGEVDVLVCWEASRAQRDLEVYVQLRALCQRHNVLWSYSGRVYDLSRTDDRFTTGLDALLAEREVGQTRDRILRDIRTHAARGGVHGTTPYGYRRVYDRHTGVLQAQVPDEVTAPVVRELAARVLAGETLYGIVQDLNRRAIPTPQQHKDLQRDVVVERGGWTSSKVRRVLSNRSVIGVRTHLGQLHPEPTWEPLISEADFDTVAAILAAPGRIYHRGVAPKHLLSGIAECGVCGAWLRAETNRGRPVYQCGGRGDGAGKGHVSRPRRPLEVFVSMVVRERLADPRIREAMIGAQPGGESATAQRELVGLQARLAELEAAIEAGTLTAARGGRIEARLLERIEDVQARALPRSLPPVLARMIGPQGPQMWDELERRELLMQQRQLVRAFVRVVVNRSNLPRGARGFDASSVVVTPLLG